jgi:hypothetical protein
MPEDAHHSFEVVGEHMKAHLSAHPRQGFGQVVGTSHPVLERSKRVVLCRSCPRIVLVKSDAHDWSGRMQMGGQVCAITQERTNGAKVLAHGPLYHLQCGCCDTISHKRITM